AYGAESAAGVYFGDKHGYSPDAGTASTESCGDGTPSSPRPSCAEVLQPWQAALLAGMVANPSAFDPVAHPAAATARRNLVLQDMFEQHYISRSVYIEGV